MFFIADFDKMADDSDHFSMPVDSLEKRDQNVKILEGGSSKTDDSQGPSDAIYFLKAPEENKQIGVGPSQLLPSISRAQVIE